MSSTVDWPNPPPDVKLLSGDLHIWSAALDLPAEQRRQFWRLLAPDEQDRANRFRFERDKNHFT
ncbi:MAG: hypothetical protein GY803_27490, partial [Chloroflexi bacterium]|nr:hypothetical protein [Chloroflexota bacterium]